MTKPASAELVVIGAGPAGMAAAASAAKQGCNVLLLDEQAAPGGQIYRAIAHSSAARNAILGSDYQRGKPLAEGLDHPLIDYRPGAKVWRIDDDGQITWSQQASACTVAARQTIIATGALERATPLPGWTLPGAMTAGAAQILLKSSGLVPANAILAGAGPLLYLLAAQMIRAGHPPRALVETQPAASYLKATRYLPTALADWRTLKKGVSLLAEISRAGVQRYRRASELAISGNTCVEQLQFRSAGKLHQLGCDAVLLHQGVVPNTQISRALRLPHQWHAQQQCFLPVTNEGKTANPLFHIAGDGAAINGAVAAEIEGRICALHALQSLQRLTAEQARQLKQPLVHALASANAARPFLDTLYAPPTDWLRPADDTIICRCEEVSAGTIRQQVSRGCRGPNQTKAFSRCGMGPCQGRYCGLTVTEILAHENGLSHDDVGGYRIRAPIKPVTVEELASLHRR